MLFKSQSFLYLEDFGLSDGHYVHLYEAGKQRISKKLELSPVLFVNAWWLDRDIKARCHVADSPEKRIAGLQPFESLGEREAMYFPFTPGSHCAFHQGTVPFSLDILWLRNGCVAKIEQNTRVGYDDHWSCDDCEGVLELNAGFVKKNGVELNDRIMLQAVSEQDLVEVQRENLVTILGDRL